MTFDNWAFERMVELSGKYDLTTSEIEELERLYMWNESFNDYILACIDLQTWYDKQGIAVEV